MRGRKKIAIEVYEARACVPRPVGYREYSKWVRACKKARYDHRCEVGMMPRKMDAGETIDVKRGRRKGGAAVRARHAEWAAMPRPRSSFGNRTEYSRWLRGCKDTGKAWEACKTGEVAG